MCWNVEKSKITQQPHTMQTNAEEMPWYQKSDFNSDQTKLKMSAEIPSNNYKQVSKQKQ